MKQAKKERWVDNELTTRYLCNKLRQEHRREWMMPGGDQSGQKVGIMGSQRHTLKMLIQSVLILCELCLLFDPASHRRLGVAGVAWSTSIEAHVNVTGSKPGKRQR